MPMVGVMRVRRGSRRFALVIQLVGSLCVQLSHQRDEPLYVVRRGSPKRGVHLFPFELALTDSLSVLPLSKPSSFFFHSAAACGLSHAS